MKILKLLVFIILFQILFLSSSFAKTIDYIVAIVDKEVITASELREKLEVLARHYIKIYNTDKLEELLKQARENILKETIEEKILLINADKANIEVTDGELEKSMEEFKKGFYSEEEFLTQLKAEGLTLADFKDKTKTRIKISKFIRLNIIKDVKITEEEIESFYEENRTSFLAPAQIKISQILIKNTGNSDAEARIGEIFQKLKAGEDFSLLAKTYSEGPNAVNGGDLGFVYPEQLQPQIKEAVSKLNAGEFTEPVLSSLGYNIIKLEAKKMPQYAPLSEVSELIKRRIYDIKVEKVYEDWMNNAKKDIDIVLIEE